jgi:nucleoside-diphosphate-sugar epimerase
MRILLTGATGFLGNNLLVDLLGAGHEVTATLRHSSDRRPLDGLDVSRAVVDLTENSEVAPLVGQHDAVIHAAAMIRLICSLSADNSSTSFASKVATIGLIDF